MWQKLHMKMESVHGVKAGSLEQSCGCFSCYFNSKSIDRYCHPLAKLSIYAYSDIFWIMGKQNDCWGMASSSKQREKLGLPENMKGPQEIVLMRSSWNLSTRPEQNACQNKQDAGEKGRVPEDVLPDWFFFFFFSKRSCSCGLFLGMLSSTGFRTLSFCKWASIEGLDFSKPREAHFKSCMRTQESWGWWRQQW